LEPLRYDNQHYCCINYQEDGAHGWGVPMATDIAFTLIDGFARKQCQGVKGFYPALAVSDDLGAILVIAFFMATAS
jgi:NhaA family Na+:H+ antiporter